MSAVLASDIAGQPRAKPPRVPVVSFRHYQALSFSDGTTTATVVSRHPLPELPQFDWVTDLEPYFAGSRKRLHERAERAGLIS
jgi:hypothetical protein